MLCKKLTQDYPKDAFLKRLIVNDVTVNEDFFSVRFKGAGGGIHRHRLKKYNAV